MTDVDDLRIRTPAAPAVAGLRLRHWAGERDLPAMFRANLAARTADGELERVTLEDMTSQYRHLENCDLERDLLIAEIDGEIVGYVRVDWVDSNDGERWYGSTAVLDPAVRRRGIGRAMLAWSEARRREIYREQLAAASIGERPTRLTTFVLDGDVGGHALLRGAGYEVQRRFFEMVRPDLDDVPDVPLPDGLEIRAFGPERDRVRFRPVFDAATEAFRDHFGPVEGSDRQFEEFVEYPSGDPTLWVVAYDGDEVAGAVLNAIRDSGQGPVDGWLDSVFTRRPWRRRGLARALIARSLTRLRDRGARRALLGVDATNPNQALHLYESCGFAVASSATAYRKDIAPPERGRGGGDGA